jgi:hypothetical protein
MVDLLRAMSKDFVQDLRPGQKKLTPEQATQVQTMQEFGLSLDDEITSLQKEVYGEAIREAERVVKDSKRAAKVAEAEFQKADQAEIDWWEKNGLESKYYEHFYFDVLENKSTDKFGFEPGDPIKDIDTTTLKPYSDWNTGESHPFEWKRFLAAKEIHAAGEIMRKKTNQAYSHKQRAKDAVVNAIRKVAAVKGATYNQALLHVLGRYRDFGGADARNLSIEFGTKVAKEDKGQDEDIQRKWLRAAERFPSDWLGEMVQHRRDHKTPLLVGPGLGYMSGSDALFIQAERASGSGKVDAILWNPMAFGGFSKKDEGEKRDFAHSALVHEMMHYMEKINPNLGRAGNAYRVWRNQQGKEFGYDYASRDYRKTNQKALRSLSKEERAESMQNRGVQAGLQWRHSEVLSTGIENMVPGGSHIDQVDREHRGFVLAVLALF